MKIGKGLLGKLGLAITGAVLDGVSEIEAIVKALPGLKGQAKQDALVELVRNGLRVAEGVSDRDLLDDAEVVAATRAVIDAVVHLHNVIAKHAPSPKGSTGD